MDPLKCRAYPRIKVGDNVENRAGVVGQVLDIYEFNPPPRLLEVRFWHQDRVKVVRVYEDKVRLV